jgi:asparagine synthase (glutamine-hydrolysing)
VGLGNARLSIIDLSSGDQPIGNEDGTLWIVFNGEIFNYLELRPELEARGHRFSTHSDTEVILHLFEEYGPDCLNHLNGQFAIAIWDATRRRLFLARDRLGVRPLFYTVHNRRLVFGSEVKALLAFPDIQAKIDPTSLAQIFTYWSTLAPHTAFHNINEMPPGHYMLVESGRTTVKRYWGLEFTQESDRNRSEQSYLDEFECLLVDATRIRLRADVPVGAYLSGGLDSSTISAVVRKYTRNRLDTFSIAFVDDHQYDESRYQQQMATELGTDHHVMGCTHADIGRVFPEVIWHTEAPVLRTAPAPMFLLSKLVHDNHLKVVLTGEGADEFLAGYDIFKEMTIRRFWARCPESQLRPLLLKRLYPDIAGLRAGNDTYLKVFFGKDLGEVSSPFYSHALRWSNTGRIRRFLKDGGASSANGKAEGVVQGSPELPEMFGDWSPLAQAQYLEATIFLPQYLLSSQGDRMAMAHSVEGRFPFLDHRVVAFCSRLPPRLMLSGLTEKWLLKQLGKKMLPSAVWQRPKRPYRAPIHRSFFGPHTPEYVRELLSEEALRESGYFDSTAVGLLVGKAAGGARMSEIDDMALVGIISTQLVHQQFVKEFRKSSNSISERVKLVDRVQVTKSPTPA